MKQRTALLSLLLVMTFSLSACQMPGLQRATTPPPPSEPQIALALPRSGPYAPIAGKIIQGANLAVKELQTNGIKIKLNVINTSVGDWIAKVNALPAANAVIGGPLHGSAYAAARKAGLLEKRAFFAFMPALETGDEGTRAWRFFTSRRDQIDAIVDFSTDTLGIRTFGAFYPADQYSLRMVNLFENALQEKGMPLQKASYNSADSSTWPTAAAQIVKPTQKEGSSTPIPNTTCEALFLPGVWKDVPQITTSLLYNGEDRLVLLGTNSWEQSLSGKSIAESDKYLLTVFPGAWDPNRAPKALRTPGNDFWVALGYDFARFAANINLSSRESSQAITTRIRSLRMLWGMAPIQWDDNGVAHQKLYLFQPAANGIKPLDVSDFRRVRTAVQQRAALRIQGLPAVDEQGQPLVEGLPPMPQPAQQNATTPAVTPPSGIGTTPLPSYKLRLPSSAQ